LASLAVPAHRRITVGRYLVGLPRPLFALRRPVAERLRIHNNIGVWRRLAAMLMSARLLAGVKALFTSRLFEGCGKAQYKVSWSCFSQRQVVDYARATCFYGTPALSGCQLAEATASLSQLFVQAFPSESAFKQTRLLPTDKAQPSCDFW